MLTVEDRAAIHQLAARYCHALDVRDPDAVAATFTDDGVLESAWVGMGVLKGHEDIKRYFRQGRGGEVRHWTNSALLEGNGDEARMRMYLMSMRVAASVREVVVTGRYDDTLRKIDGQWLFAHRRLTFDQPMRS